LVGTGDVVLVVLALAGQTNSATTLDHSLPTSGGRRFYGAMVERCGGPSRLHDDDRMFAVTHFIDWSTFLEMKNFTCAADACFCSLGSMTLSIRDSANTEKWLNGINGIIMVLSLLKLNTNGIDCHRCMSQGGSGLQCQSSAKLFFGQKATAKMKKINIFLFIQQKVEFIPSK